MIRGLILLYIQCVLSLHHAEALGFISMDTHKLFASVQHESEPVRMVFKEKSKHEHRLDFRRVSRSDRDRNHEVIFAVKQRNIDKLEKMLLEVSNPKSRMYGKHKSRKEVNELTINHESAQHILLFLKNQNIAVSKVSKNKGFITASAPIHLWESLFGAEFYDFESVDGSSENVACALEYSIPEYLENHVHAVFNTVQLPMINTIKSIVQPKSSEKSPIHSDAGVLISGYVTPALLNTYYNIPKINGSVNATQAVYSDGSNYFSPSDLSTFQRTFKLYQNPVDTVIGGNSNDAMCVSNPNACGESNLDLQYLMAVSQLSPTTYHHYSGNQAFLGWIQQVADLDQPALVHSISFGLDEFSGYNSYFDSFNTEAIKLGVTGVTLLASSGDDGAVGASVRTSWTNCAYNPSFPASSPYVTAGPETNSVEVVCQTDNGGTITSGGGFSTLFSLPDWQNASVSSYFARMSGTDQEPFPGYAVGGRGIPDVTLAAENYAIFIGGSKTGVSGTSASCPAFAGMISLINAERIAAGKSSLGWINPALYENYNSFTNDITSGHNKCSVGPTCCSQGFSATDGWDPVTGLGSVNFNSMLNVFMSLGDEVLNVPTVVPTAGVTAPTVRPSMTPSLQPTTVAPTSASGWLSFNLYAAEGCANPVGVVTGVKTNQCFQLYSNNTFAFEYIKYTCDAVEGHYAMYSDGNCTQIIGSITSFALGCATKVADTSSSTIGSASITCTSGTSSLPIDTAQSFMTQRNFNTGGCVGSDFSSFNSYLKDTCVNNFGVATKATLTSLNTYSSLSSCSSNGAASTSTSFTVGSCVSFDGSANDDTDAANEMWTFDVATTTYSPSVSPTTYRPTKAPSLRPTTIAPTVSPTSSAPTAAPTSFPYYKFTVQQILIGISEAKYNWNSSRNDLILRHAVAACMTGLSYKNISVIKVVVGPSIDGTSRPSPLPSIVPTVNTLIPTAAPTVEPTGSPTVSHRPSVAPTEAPTVEPTISISPSMSPTLSPTQSPTLSLNPTVVPSLLPSVVPSLTPSLVPSLVPSISPSPRPSLAPTCPPTVDPTQSPSVEPSTEPSLAPSEAPTYPLTQSPSVNPTRTPTDMPSVKPTRCPTLSPSIKPTRGPSLAPSIFVSRSPTAKPTTHQPSTGVTSISDEPSEMPTLAPSEAPSWSLFPSLVPTEQPSMSPTLSDAPSEEPSDSPTDAPQLRRRFLSEAGGSGVVESTNITYNVHFDIRALGFDSPEPAYVTLITELQDAVVSGLFDTHLAAFASQFAGGNLTGVVSGSISVSNYTVDIVDTSNDDDDGTGNIAISKKNLIIIGISIAAGLGMFCIGILVVLFCNGEATVAPSISQK